MTLHSKTIHHKHSRSSSTFILLLQLPNSIFNHDEFVVKLAYPQDHPWPLPLRQGYMHKNKTCNDHPVAPTSSARLNARGYRKEKLNNKSCNDLIIISFWMKVFSTSNQGLHKD